MISRAMLLFRGTSPGLSLHQVKLVERLGKGRRQAWPHQHARVSMPEHPPHEAHEATDGGGLLHAGGWAEPPSGTAIPPGLQMLLEEGT